MSATGVKAAKAALRREAAERRRAAARAAGDAGGRLLAQFLAELLPPPGAVVAGYWPKDEEMDVRPLLRHLHREARQCALPVVVGRGRPLAFRAWTPETVLAPAGFGVMEPPAEAVEVRPDLVVVPLLAFDRRGHRLGYGAGYYDRTLAALRAEGEVVAVGAAYAAQETAEVPHHASDERLDWIVTEAETIPVSGRTVAL